ncbi:hypothetical protein JD844_032048 [Phrynosoma platyrhinos]|uniref:Uncharacterized protein n=1 Tax=Phrynosoma platyrhinos TaxID=52577 RepID=A0ABQ7T4J5_PHRPL|nr:hypothetical protein JD844_032048 [Phrynosoma platyrhinos]
MLSAKDFSASFNNKEWPKHTLVFFTVRQKNSPDLEKFLKSNAPNKHAEIFVLEELQKHIPQNEENYIVTLFMSYTPCADCSERILNFLKQNTRVSMEIHASVIFHEEDFENLRGLRLLNNAGVSISMMNQRDYEECFQLLVSPQEEFVPWDELDKNSERNANSLARILNRFYLMLA